MKQASLQPVFHGVETLPPDNGEVFLSEYFHQQNERNKSLNLDSTNNKCICLACQMFSFPLLGTVSSRDVNHVGTKAQLPKQTQVDIVPPRPAPAEIPKRHHHASMSTIAHTQANVHNEQELAPILQFPLHSNAPLPITAPHIVGAVQKQTSPIPSRANHPYFVSANFFCHLPHFMSPPQCCCPYPPYYCPARLTWISKGGHPYLPDPPPHHRGCPGWRPRGAVPSPFLHMNSC